jgi:hydrogenase-4 component E
MDWLLTGALLTTFIILGTERISSCIYAVAWQGAMIAALPFLTHSTHWRIALLVFSITLLVKALLIPALLLRSLGRITILRYSEFIVRPHLALLGGGLLVVASFSASSSLPGPPGASHLDGAVALSMLLVGFFLLVIRSRAISQVIGFLVMENGIFLFGVTLAAHFPLIVELGVLLDLLAGILVMGIMVHHIHQTFDHIDTRIMSQLGDSE